MKKNIKKVNPIKSFLFWCSGTSGEILENLPYEHVKYITLGISLLGTSIFTFFSMLGAAHYFFDNLFLSILASGLWASMILIIYRYIISTTIPIDYTRYKETAPFKKAISLIPRLILVIMISLVTIQPFLVRLFKQEIDLSISKKNIELINKSRAVIDSNIIELSRLQFALKLQKNIIKQSEDELNKEVNGIGRTHRIGLGQMYYSMKNEHEILLKTKDSLQTRINNLNNEIYRQNEIQKLIVPEFSSTFINQIAALEELTEHNSLIYKTMLLIVFLFLIMSMFPLILKLLIPNGEYDLIIAKMEKERYRDTIDSLQNEIIGELDKSKINPEYSTKQNQNGNFATN